ncbi:hypothetical protein ['Paenibacillus yunnanensis' Narsing Rao et al. 2020]|uniref:hypothetical protein n=1 Tax=Paenibacillus tengchongensis TaxID=2608684 RepID=UPI0016526CAE|nr:hypothetical protein [Paenibacillus tengchongensis]
MPASPGGARSRICSGSDRRRIGGRIYGIPVVNPTNVYHVPVVYRQDWLDKLGLALPDTLADFEKVIYAFADGDPDGNGIRDAYGCRYSTMSAPTPIRTPMRP